MPAGLLVVLAEVALRLFLPYSFYTVGHVGSANSARYGWGFDPHEVVRVGNPDTGEAYVAPVNASGWRDREHSVDNPTGAFRILVLGDSETFGAIVPADKIYPRQLEDALRREGYNVEVISMAYGGFATDQELEALKAEGLQYRPQLVVLQFGENDLVENTGRSEFKPFRYSLDDRGTLHRQGPIAPPPPTLRQRAKATLFRSELIKRLYSTVTLGRMAVGSGPASYYVTAGRWELLARLFKLKDDDPVLTGLRVYRDKAVSAADLRAVLERSIRFYDSDLALRIFEKHWINTYVHGPGRERADGASYSWRLYFALVDEIARVAREGNADLALFSDTEIGSYRWLVYWGWLEDSADTRNDYLSVPALQRSHASQTGIGFIENELEHVRSRNDPHATALGHAAMAENVRRYVHRHYNLAPYRTAAR